MPIIRAFRYLVLVLFLVARPFRPTSGEDFSILVAMAPPEHATIDREAGTRGNTAADLRWVFTAGQSPLCLQSAPYMHTDSSPIFRTQKQICGVVISKRYVLCTP